MIYIGGRHCFYFIVPWPTHDIIRVTGHFAVVQRRRGLKIFPCPLECFYKTLGLHHSCYILLQFIRLKTFFSFNWNVSKTFCNTARVVMQTNYRMTCLVLAHNWLPRVDIVMCISKTPSMTGNEQSTSPLGFCFLRHIVSRHIGQTRDLHLICDTRVVSLYGTYISVRAHLVGRFMWSFYQNN